MNKLITTASRTVLDPLNCDGWFELIAEFADARIQSDELSEALTAVKVHFSQCPCCVDKYAARLESLQEPEMILN